MTDEITKKIEGRPTTKTDVIVQKLVEVLRLGVKDTAACAHAGIGRSTFYQWMNEDEDFADKIETAKNFAILAARQVVVKSIIEDKDLNTSKWYLEKHDIPQQQVQNQTQVNVFAGLRDRYTKHTVDEPTIVIEEKKNE